MVALGDLATMQNSVQEFGARVSSSAGTWRREWLIF